MSDAASDIVNPVLIWLTRGYSAGSDVERHVVKPVAQIAQRSRSDSLKMLAVATESSMHTNEIVALAEPSRQHDVQPIAQLHDSNCMLARRVVFVSLQHRLRGGELTKGGGVTVPYKTMPNVIRWTAPHANVEPKTVAAAKAHLLRVRIVPLGWFVGERQVKFVRRCAAEAGPAIVNPFHERHFKAFR